MISIIVAISEENAIGIRGGLLCHLPNDLQHFKSITAGHSVIMGERTYLSLPKHPLPNRRNIVITDQEGKQFEGTETVYSIEQAVALIRPNEEAFIIGGGMIYRQFMPLADKLYITHIHHSWQDADTFFPTIAPEHWIKISEEHHRDDDANPYPYSFTEYVRK